MKPGYSTKITGETRFSTGPGIMLTVGSPVAIINCLHTVIKAFMCSSKLDVGPGNLYVKYLVQIPRTCKKVIETMGCSKMIVQKGSGVKRENG
jgi:hypothetical protein